MKDYSDIIKLTHHVSKKHKPMSLYNRAAQFSPFAALVGYDQIIAETGRMTDVKPELDEYEKSEINAMLQMLAGNREAEIELVYFLKDETKEGGECLNERCRVRKIDEDRRLIITDKGIRISIDDILHISFI